MDRFFGSPRHGTSRIDIVETFPEFVPNSTGNYRMLAPLTVQAINQTVVNLRDLALDVTPAPRAVQSVTSFATGPDDLEAAQAIKLLFDKYGSDKGASHNYHFLYGPLLKSKASSKLTGILEIGLGSNNKDVVSNMGPRGKPGASLRAFKEFTNAAIYGADVDERILFEEPGIRTFFVDQTNGPSLADLAVKVPSDLDLIIDDGLHTPNANLATLRFGLSKIKVGGWVVIEDVAARTVPLWEVVSSLLSNSFECHILSAHNGMLFVVRRLS